MNTTSMTTLAKPIAQSVQAKQSHANTLLQKLPPRANLTTDKLLVPKSKEKNKKRQERQLQDDRSRSKNKTQARDSNPNRSNSSIVAKRSPQQSTTVGRNITQVGKVIKASKSTKLPTLVSKALPSANITRKDSSNLSIHSDKIKTLSKKLEISVTQPIKRQLLEMSAANPIASSLLNLTNSALTNKTIVDVNNSKVVVKRLGSLSSKKELMPALNLESTEQIIPQLLILEFKVNASNATLTWTFESAPKLVPKLADNYVKQNYAEQTTFSHELGGHNFKFLSLFGSQICDSSGELSINPKTRLSKRRRRNVSEPTVRLGLPTYSLVNPGHNLRPDLGRQTNKSQNEIIAMTAIQPSKPHIALVNRRPPKRSLRDIKPKNDNLEQSSSITESLPTEARLINVSSPPQSLSHNSTSTTIPPKRQSIKPKSGNNQRKPKNNNNLLDDNANRSQGNVSIANPIGFLDITKPIRIQDSTSGKNNTLPSNSTSKVINATEIPDYPSLKIASGLAGNSTNETTTSLKIVSSSRMPSSTTGKPKVAEDLLNISTRVSTIPIVGTELSTSSTLAPSPTVDYTTTTAAQTDSIVAMFKEHQTKPDIKLKPLIQNQIVEWIVYVRKFASTETKIAKIVLNATSIDHLPIRSLIFDNLKPGSGYELCIEAAASNQQLNDKYNLLSIRESFDASSSHPHAPLSTKKCQTKDTGAPTKYSIESQLCKEFFTLPDEMMKNQSDNLQNVSVIKSGDASETLPAGTSVNHQMTKLNADHNQAAMVTPSFVGEEDNGNLAIPRRPKHLHPQLLVNIAGDGFNQAAISRHDATNIDSIALPDSLSLPVLSNSTNLNVQSRGFGDPTFKSSSSSSTDKFVTSAIPIIACVFFVIFLLTLANILLNAVACSAARHSRRRRSLRVAARNLRVLAAKTASGSNLNSTTTSDTIFCAKSNGRPSRYLVSNGNVMPFNSSFYDLPNDRPASFGALASSHRQHQSNITGTKNISSALESHPARFPLSPSFEGDGRHNADMVGLARKNYDQFVNQLLAQRAAEAETSDSSPFELSGASSSQSLLPGISSSHLSHCSNSTSLCNTKNTKNLMSSALSAVHPPPPPSLPEQFFLQEQNQQISAHMPNSQDETNNVQHRSPPGQRLRFDKINPAYAAGNVISKSNNLHVSNLNNSYFHMSSFGRSAGQAMLQKQAIEMNGNLADAFNPNLNQQLTNTPTSSTYSCCLDKQQQRFERQQEQLVTNSSPSSQRALPQPFIHAPTSTISTPCGYSIVNDNESVCFLNDGLEQKTTNGAGDSNNKDTNSARENQISQDPSGSASDGSKTTASISSMNCSSECNMSSASSLSNARSVTVAAVEESNQGKNQKVNSEFQQRRNELASKLNVLSPNSK